MGTPDDDLKRMGKELEGQLSKLTKSLEGSLQKISRFKDEEEPSDCQVSCECLYTCDRSPIGHSPPHHCPHCGRTWL